MNNQVTSKKWQSAQHLLRSIGWALGSTAGWILLVVAISSSPIGGNSAGFLVFGGFLLAHILIWKYVVCQAALYAECHKDTPTWLSVLGVLWGLLMLLYQIGSALLILLVLVIALDPTPINNN